MTSPPPFQPAWNFSELLVRVENDQELLRDLLNIFKTDLPPLLESLKSAVAATDMKKTASLSHALRGMLANLAGTRAAAVAAELERLANAANPDLLGATLRRLEEETASLNQEIDAYLQGARA